MGDPVREGSPAAETSRRERREQEVRSRIFEASVRLFEEATSVVEICERADVAHKTLLCEVVRAAHESGTESDQARKLHDAFGALILDGRTRGDLCDRHAAETQTEMLNADSVTVS